MGSMQIPFFDLTKETLAIGDGIDSAINRVISSGRFILGREVETFEQGFAHMCSCRYAVGVATGTDALFLALKAMGVGPGDEVITVSHSFAATALAIIYTGAQPVFVDIEDRSYLMDPDCLEHAITKRTKVIIPVHLYGMCANMSRIREIARAHGLLVLEDACQAHGALYRGEPAGSMGDAAAFSFYPTKNLGAYGDGGMITTNDAGLYDRLIMLRNYGQLDRYHFEMLGYNSRLDEIQAAILKEKLPYLKQWTTRRQEIAHRYDRGIGSLNLVGQQPEQGSTHVYHLYVIAVEDRDGLKTFLEKQGVQTLIHYPVPIHKQKTFNATGKFMHLGNTELRATQVLSLPMRPWITDEEIEYIIERIQEYYA